MRTSHTKLDIEVSDYEGRRPFIGASEAHKTLPDSEYMHTFWNEKVGHSTPPDISDLPQIKRGNRFIRIFFHNYNATGFGIGFGRCNWLIEC